MIRQDITLEDLGFSDESEKCCIKFSKRANGSLRCRLVFSEYVSEVLRDVSGGMVSATVDQHGNVVIKPSGSALKLSSDLHAWVSLDRYASLLYREFGGDTAYESLVLLGSNVVVMTPCDSDGGQYV